MPKQPDQLLLLGKTIRKVRKERGYSQEGLCLEAGLARGYFGGVERGQRNPSAENLIRIVHENGNDVKTIE